MHDQTTTHRGLLRQLTSSAAGYRLLDATPSAATDRALKFAGGGFYVSGGVATILLALLSRGVEHPLPVLLIGAAATVTGLAVAYWSGRVSPWMRKTMNLMGTTLVMCIVLLCGSGGGGPAEFWLFCYVPVDSFFFFPWRWAIPMVAWGFTASAIAAVGSHSVHLTQWSFSVLVGVVSSVAVGALVRSAADAEWDSATDMLSRKGLERELERRCHRTDAESATFSLACLSIQEIDQGRCNRSRADLLTLQVARLLREHAGSDCRWARLRDHELAVICDGADVDGYLSVVRECVRPAAEISLGVTDWQPGEKATELLAAAMRGLHRSETSGGTLCRSGIVAAQVSDLRRALAAGEIRPYYQPIVRLEDGAIIGAEALARWIHPEHGLITPDRFIALAEESGLISILGASILHRACVDACTWPALPGGAPRKLTVNAAGAQLCDPGFPDVVTAALRDSDLPAERLVLEVTESTFYEDDPVAHESLRRIRAHGVRIAIDDFGTGFSNLSRLAQLPADILKVDRSFIADLSACARVRSLLRGLAAMSCDLGFLSLVEGVETPEDAATLHSLGIVEAQGYLYGRPMPLDAFVATVRAAAGDRDPVVAGRSHG